MEQDLFQKHLHSHLEHTPIIVEGEFFIFHALGPLRDIIPASLKIASSLNVYYSGRGFVLWDNHLHDEKSVPK